MEWERKNKNTAHFLALACGQPNTTVYIVSILFDFYCSYTIQRQWYWNVGKNERAKAKELRGLDLVCISRQHVNNIYYQKNLFIDRKTQHSIAIECNLLLFNLYRFLFALQWINQSFLFIIINLLIWRKNVLIAIGLIWIFSPYIRREQSMLINFFRQP